VLRQQPRVEIRFGRGDAGVAQPLPRREDLGVDARDTAAARAELLLWYGVSVPRVAVAESVAGRRGGCARGGR
jgi:hypothetical protein